LYDKLGLKQEDEKGKKAKEEACGTRASSSLNENYVEELVCGDHVPDEVVSLGDWRNPIMSLGSRYKDMVTFRLAMRQYAIKKEFEIGIEATDQTRYRVFCQGEACPWKIHARVKVKGSPIVIVSLFVMNIM
jgi:hypothetical protein